MNVDDESWAPAARVSREALALLGRQVEPKCLPDESDPCGASFAMHAMAHYAWLQAIADHQLHHLGPEFEDAARDVYWSAVAELDQTCPEQSPQKTPGNPQ